MLNIERLNEKVKELNNEKLSAFIEWEEEELKSENPLNDGVLPGNLVPNLRFRLEGISTKKAKLYIYDEAAGCFRGIMILDR